LIVDIDQMTVNYIIDEGVNARKTNVMARLDVLRADVAQPDK
jgi:hypothetical protein